VATIKMMLEVVAEDEARKEAKEADVKQTEANELSVIIQGYSICFVKLISSHYLFILIMKHVQMHRSID